MRVPNVLLSLSSWTAYLRTYLPYNILSLRVLVCVVVEHENLRTSVADSRLYNNIYIIYITSFPYDIYYIGIIEYKCCRTRFNDSRRNRRSVVIKKIIRSDLKCVTLQTVLKCTNLSIKYIGRYKNK